MVHQIWLGDRRDDPTAANYSAEDLVVVQRDIGRLARYTVEMGGGVDLLEIALKIPPWEPMRMLSRDELRTMKVETAGDGPEINSGTATNSAALSNGARGALNWRRVGRCCWMSWQKCRSVCRQSYCAFWRIRKCGGWAARPRPWWMFA